VDWQVFLLTLLALARTLSKGAAGASRAVWAAICGEMGVGIGKQLYLWFCRDCWRALPSRPTSCRHLRFPLFAVE
jgi:hypothetical protein